jgi:hypothetical protein
MLGTIFFASFSQGKSGESMKIEIKLAKKKKLIPSESPLISGKGK